MCDPKSHNRFINKGILLRNNMNSRVISPNSGIRAPPAITPGCISVLAFCLPDLCSALYQIRFRLPASRQSAICVLMHGPISGEESLRVLLSVFFTMLCIEV